MVFSTCYCYLSSKRERYCASRQLFNTHIFCIKRDCFTRYKPQKCMVRLVIAMIKLLITGLVCANVFGVYFRRSRNPLHDEIRAGLSSKKPKASISCFLCQVLIQWFYRFRHHFYHCKPGVNALLLNACLVVITAHAMRASLLANATVTTLKGFVARKFASHSP